MSSHWFEMRGCPSCGHVWHVHQVEEFSLGLVREVRPYVINEELVCPACRHEFLYPTIHLYARPGYVCVELTENELKNGYVMGNFRIVKGSSPKQTEQE